MNLKIKHIIIILANILFSACAMETKTMKNADTHNKIVTLDEEEIIADFEADSQINAQLITQKLQDFYDLIALNNKHPEFADDVTKQLKNYTSGPIDNFTVDDIVLIKNIKQLGNIISVNDSTQKIKLTYKKVTKSIKAADTIYAIISNKTIMIDGKNLVSNKIQFSKN